MDTTRVGNEPSGLPSGTGTNSSISSLDPTVVDILRNNFGFRIGGKSLGSRSAEASGSRGSESVSTPKNESVSTQESKFQSFIDKAKMGFLDRCLILVKTIISRDYGLEVAKQILGKLIQIGKDSKTSSNLDFLKPADFLKAAFGAIASPENGDNVAHNIKHLLRLSKGKIATIDIINEFKNIGDVDRRIAFLCKLKENLSEEEKTEFKEFLEGTLDGIADQIADEFEKNQDKDKAALFEKLKSVDLLKTALLAEEKVGVPSLVRLMNNNKLPNLKLTEEESKAVVNKLLGCGAEGLKSLEKLINDDRLLSLSLWDSSTLKKFACALLEQGPSGLAVVKALIENGKLKPEQFEAQDAKEFVDALLAYGLSGADYVLKLIDDSKLTKLESTDEAKTRAFQFKELHSTFERGITKAFFGKKHNVDGKFWEAIRSQLKTLTLGEACGIWQTIANEIAASCFEKNGKVDSDRLKGLMAFLGHKEIFKKPPYCFIPNAELMRSQMYTVCESLFNNKSKALDLLNDANKIRVGSHGRAILATMSKGRTQSLTPPIAILSSLFTPHRQRSLPTCAMNSLINAEIRNHPERLIEMYGQMLGGNQFTLPSGHAIRQQKIGGGFITVDLKNGGDGRNAVFREIISGDLAKVERQRNRWLKEGIKYPESGNPGDQYKLSLQVHNMNDILFAHFFQASSFGNNSITEDLDNYGTMLLYAGHKECTKIHPTAIFVGGSNFSSIMAELIEHAETQRKLGNHYMHVATKQMNGYYPENIDIDALLDLDLNNMKIGEACPIGDRNWSSWNSSHDIPRLAIKKVDDIPTYKFGTLNGSIFERIDIEKFDVYTTDIEYHAVVQKRTPFSFGNFFKASISLFINILGLFSSLLEVHTALNRGSLIVEIESNKESVIKIGNITPEAGEVFISNEVDVRPIWQQVKQLTADIFNNFADMIGFAK
jgi:hypothetical protein